jgi:hypothetical protein
MRRYMLSAALLRRVSFAVVAEDAGRDAAGFAVSAVSSAPYLALFPERYLEGAERYAAAANALGSTRVAVMNDGEGKGVSIGKTEPVRINRNIDLYRAGKCAAILAKDGDIALIYADPLPDSYWEAFNAGLVAGGYQKEPVFYHYAQLITPAGLGCAVLFTAVNQSVFEAKPEVPIILFSWFTPEYTPRGTMVVFDDSPLAVAAQIARRSPVIKSQASILASRVRNRSEYLALRAAIRGNAPDSRF